MRDGVELLTDVYEPEGTSLGTVLVRTPYGRRGLVALSPPATTRAMATTWSTRAVEGRPVWWARGTLQQ